MENLSQIDQSTNQGDSQSELSQHEQEMINKVDERNNAIQEELSLSTEAADEDFPLIDGKFKSQEDLLKAYKELEKKLHSPTQEETLPTPQATTEAEAKEVVEAVGLDFSNLYTEFQSNGALSEASYQALAEKGIPEDVVNAYIEGQAAKRSLVEMQVKNEIGGDQEYLKMINWASKNLTAEEIAYFNRPMNSEEYKLAVDSLYGKYVRVNGKPPKLIQGDAVSNHVSGYATRMEMMKDIASPAYNSDPHFRKQVQAKIAISNVI